MEVDKFFRNLDNWLLVKVNNKYRNISKEILSFVRIIGLQNPYLVLMDFNVQSVQSHAAALGFDAISTYALPGGTTQVIQIFFLHHFE